MGNPHKAKDEIARLRRELDAETERRLEVQRKLDQANSEFEHFVSMAAHDLREPLRAVASYSQLLAETYAGRLDSDADSYLERIQEGAARMQALLSDVVDYCVTGAGDRPSSATNLEAALNQALLCAEKQIAQRSAIVTHDTLPPVCGDFEVLTKVLHHLIRNGIEYCETCPRIHVSCKRGTPDWVFSVQDNGPGIDPAFHGQIFEVFKRLHGKEHPGNGLGLAFCKKAIEWHGGRIWLESTPGEGSTICFTLPPAETD